MTRDDHTDPLLVAAGTDGNERFGELLKHYRIGAGLTPQELADKAHVHVSFVRGIERGAQAPSAATAETLLACLTMPYSSDASDGSDLVIRDSEAGKDVSFVFKAKMKGQNRRPDRDQISYETVPWPWPRSNETCVQEADLSRDARLGRAIRMLMNADEETLAALEYLLSNPPRVPAEPDA